MLQRKALFRFAVMFLAAVLLAGCGKSEQSKEVTAALREADTWPGFREWTVGLSTDARQDYVREQIVAFEGLSRVCELMREKKIHKLRLTSEKFPREGYSFRELLGQRGVVLAENLVLLFDLPFAERADHAGVGPSFDDPIALMDYLLNVLDRSGASSFRYTQEQLREFVRRDFEALWVQIGRRPVVMETDNYNKVRLAASIARAAKFGITPEAVGLTKEEIDQFF